MAFIPLSSSLLVSHIFQDQGPKGPWAPAIKSEMMEKYLGTECKGLIVSEQDTVNAFLRRYSLPEAMVIKQLKSKGGIQTFLMLQISKDLWEEKIHSVAQSQERLAEVEKMALSTFGELKSLLISHIFQDEGPRGPWTQSPCDSQMMEKHLGAGTEGLPASYQDLVNAFLFQLNLPKAFVLRQPELQVKVKSYLILQVPKNLWEERIHPVTQSEQRLAEVQEVAQSVLDIPKSIQKLVFGNAKASEIQRS